MPWVASTVTWDDNPKVINMDESAFAVQIDEIQTKAVLDCGASESIIGAHTLQLLYDQYLTLAMDPEKEISIDRQQRRSFIFGKNETSLVLGFARVTVGVADHTVKIPIHVVKGQTPTLLSSRWLEEHSAVIDFKSQKAQYGFLNGASLQLERSRTNHLLLPMTTFARDSSESADPTHGAMSHHEAFVLPQLCRPRGSTTMP